MKSNYNKKNRTEDNLLDQYLTKSNYRKGNREDVVRKPKNQDNRGYKNNSRKNQPFKKFSEHLTEEEIQKGLDNHELFQGTLLAKQENRQIAAIKCPLFDQKILLDDIETQNRAMDGAIVVFKIIRVIEDKEKVLEVQKQKLIETIAEVVAVDTNDQEPTIKVPIPESPHNIPNDEQSIDVQGSESEKIEQNGDIQNIDQNEKKNEDPEQSCEQKKEDVIEIDQEVKDQESEEENEEDDDWSSVEDAVEVDLDIEVPKVKLTKEVREELKQKYKGNKLIGEVVGIIKDINRTKPMVGKVQIEEKYNRDGIQYAKTAFETILKNYYVTFKSINKKIPWFKISEVTKHLVEEFGEAKNKKMLEEAICKIQGYYFKGQFLAWNLDSKYPVLKLIDKIGLAGDIEIECSALLAEHQVNQMDFSEECIHQMEILKKQCNQDGEYVIPESERVNRLDLTNEIICTVDPVTARDLDDALSINEVSDGIYEVGVHIADVSHFVEPESFVDNEAQQRTTSVYLVHRVISMLPRILCENLCSLNPDVERLAFTVFFYLTKDGEVLWDKPIRVHKSIIKSCAKMSYDVVNDMIYGRIKSIDEIPPDYKISERVDKQKLFEKLLLLNDLAQKRRRKRLDNGSLTFDKAKLRFKLDEKFQPVAYQPEQRDQAQFMVEEWMLLANQFVAMKLVEFERATAVLRQHQPPQAAKIKYFQRQLRLCKLDHMIDGFDISRSEKLQKALQAIAQADDLKQEAKDILQFKLIKLLEAAKYFVVGEAEQDEWHHYALNFDIYTHFTSPIRRYPDILVHRLLFKTIQSPKEIQDQDQQIVKRTWDDEVVLSALMEKCNECKLAARRVSDGCEKIFMCLYLKTNPVFSFAFVTEVNLKFIGLIVPFYNIELNKNISELKNIIRANVTKDENQGSNKLIIQYRDTKDPQGKRVFVIQALTKIDVQLTASNSFPIDYLVKIAVPYRVLNEENKVEIRHHLI